jgi:DNA-binding NtrC family response regulator
MEPIRILVIDDEPVICDGCRLTLSDRCFAVDSCNSGTKGLEMLLGGEYDLALLDMKLPDMNGMEILHNVKNENPGMYIIVMTGYSSVKNAVDAMKLGAFDYIAKPFSDDELLICVQRAVETKRLKEENLALRHQLSERYDFGNIIGEDPEILKIFDAIRKVAPTDSTVLLSGESGTGKELFARAIHAHSKRAARQIVAVDCSTFSSSLLDIDGMEVIKQVKAAKPETEVIVITGYGTTATAVEAMKLGVHDFLPKPFTEDQIKKAIDEALQAHVEKPRVAAIRKAQTEEEKLIQKREVLGVLSRTAEDADFWGVCIVMSRFIAAESRTHKDRRMQLKIKMPLQW